jgi:hypothetical protein
MLGAGGYSLKEKWTATYSNVAPRGKGDGYDKSGMRPGGKIGMGAGFKASKHVSVGVGADFNFIRLDKNKTNGEFFFENDDRKVSSFHYIGIHGGVTYHIGSE